MKTINGYRLEKTQYDGRWRAFEKRGLSGWFEVKSAKTYKEIKEWAKAQKKGK